MCSETLFVDTAVGIMEICCNVCRLQTVVAAHFVILSSVLPSFELYRIANCMVGMEDFWCSKSAFCAQCVDHDVALFIKYFIYFRVCFVHYFIIK